MAEARQAPPLSNPRSPAAPREFDVAAHTQGLPGWLIDGLKHYQRIMQRNWRPSRRLQNTQRFWSGFLRTWRYLCEQCGVKEMGEFKKEHILEYIDERLADRRAASGINTDLRCLRSFLRFLQEEGYPVDGSLLRIPGLKQPDSLPRSLMDGQLQSLCNALPKQDYILNAALHLLWQGGMRLGEVEELHLPDLDLPSRMLIVRNGKGLKDRVVYLSNAAASALEDYLSVREVSEDDHVFLFRGAFLRKDWLGSRLRALGRRAGVKLHAHALRHTCATQLLNAGCRITSIQKVLGHKRLDTTMIYARVHDLTVAEDYFKVMDHPWCIKG